MVSFVTLVVGLVVAQPGRPGGHLPRHRTRYDRDRRRVPNTARRVVARHGAMGPLNGKVSRYLQMKVIYCPDCLKYRDKARLYLVSELPPSGDDDEFDNRLSCERHGPVDWVELDLSITPQGTIEGKVSNE